MSYMKETKVNKMQTIPNKCRVLHQIEHMNFSYT